MSSPQDDRDHPLARRFFDFIEKQEFPCVGAKSALGKGRIRIVIARDLKSAWNDLPIHAALMDIARDYAADPQPFQSLAVLYEHDAGLSEAEFEACLWERLQSLSDKDDWLDQPVDTRVSSDPDDPHFSLSFGGEAFFVVGLHPGASRPARRFQTPALVFNLHDQFEQLRASGIYEKLRQTITARDIALAGEPNPMLATFGTSSEAGQYSGRAVGDEWQCPFRRRGARHAA